MRLIIAGSRNLDPQLVQDKIEEFMANNLELCYSIKEVVSGAAQGVDQAGEWWAENRPDPIKVTTFPADWDAHGKAAGPIRNKQMAEYADSLLLIWNGISPGSKNMRDHMNRKRKPIHEIIITTDVRTQNESID